MNKQGISRKRNQPGRLMMLITGLGVLMLMSSSVRADEAAPKPAPPTEAADEAPGTVPAAVNEGDAVADQDCPTCQSEAAGAEDDDNLPSLFDGVNNWAGDSRFKVGGWLTQGFTWNPDSPRNRSNGPVTFNDRANEYQLNQLYLFMQRSVDPDADEWQIGGRVDLLYGTDYYFTQAAGLELEQNGNQRWNKQSGPTRAFGPNTGAQYGFALPQLYAEIGGHGWSIKAGHFYTIIGYEVVTAPDNFFYSHAYTMQYGEPFTHTGVLVSRNLGANISVTGGITNGWDSFDNTNGRNNFLGGITWNSDDEKTSLAFGITTGGETSAVGNADRTMYSIVFTRKLTDKLTWVLQHDLGVQQDGRVVSGSTRNAQWYGVNNYLFYQVHDDLKAGLRYEWFRDDDGIRVAGDGIGASYNELSLGVNWNIMKRLVLRPEVRWDWSSKKKLGRPFHDGNDGSQFLYAMDLVFTF